MKKIEKKNTDKKATADNKAVTFHVGRMVAVMSLSIIFGLGCGNANIVDSGSDDWSGQGQKDDSGWLGADTFEVNAVITSTVLVDAMGDWFGVENDADLQTKLVDMQIKFIKTSAENNGWRFNQLAEKVQINNIQNTADGVEISYEAVVDMLGNLRATVPTLDELEHVRFEAVVPRKPMGFSSMQMNHCAKVDDGHSIRDYNFHYYFKPEQENCDLDLIQAHVEVTQVFDRPVAYPEYDKLMKHWDDGSVGFAAALVPNRGDNDPKSRFNAHKQALENEMGLDGELSPDNTFIRYTWKKGNISMVIDLYDPTEVPWNSDFAAHFRARLSNYSYVHYNGHSSYGSKELLNDPAAYSNDYQIVVIHSCQSYAYYTRQVFRAKATAMDPSGMANADVVATGKSSYPAGSPPTTKVMLNSLMQGMVAIDTGRPQNAPDWITIAERIKSATWGDILYGVAGVRNNRWTTH